MEIVKAFHSPLGRMRMLGGAPVLDFANTLHWRDGGIADFIPDFEALIKFCVPAQLLSEAECSAALHAARAQPEAARRMHLEALELRQAVKTWLIQMAVNLEPKASAPARRKLSRAIAAASKGVAMSDVLGVDTPVSHVSLMLPLWRCAAAAGALLLFPPEGDIRQCEADKCGGFFINQSRSKPRRWCSMDGCGNRAKAARFRAAQRSEH